jgi:hypothetical protein
MLRKLGELDFRLSIENGRGGQLEPMTINHIGMPPILDPVVMRVRFG